MNKELMTVIAQASGERSIATHEIAVRRPLADLVEATITAACKSPHTARAYRRGIGEFVALLAQERFGGRVLVERLQHGKRKATVYDYLDAPAGVLLLVDAALLDKFAREHQQGTYAVRTLLAVAFRDGVLTQSQALAMGIKPYKSKVRRDVKPTGRRLSVMEVQFLRSAVDTSTNKGKRDLVILDLQLYAGLRRQEVSELRLADFAQDGGRWVIRLTGKGGKVRKIAVHKVLYQTLADWLSVYPHELRDDVPVVTRVRKCGELLPGGVSAQTVSDLVARYGHKAGLSTLNGDGRLTPHDCRRTFARRLHDCGAGLPEIQALLGHADPVTTIRYIGLGEDDTQGAVDLLNYG